MKKQKTNTTKEQIVYSTLKELKQTVGSLGILNLDTNTFTFKMLIEFGIKPTTSERYLRHFKATERRLLNEEVESLELNILRDSFEAVYP